MRLEVAEVLRDKRRVLEGFSSATGRSAEQLEQDFKRDFYLDANEALRYGGGDRLLLPGAKREGAEKGKISPGVGIG